MTGVVIGSREAPRPRRNDGERRPPTPRARGGRAVASGPAVAVAAVIPIALYLWIALHRVGYPYELDWMEGGSVELAARVAAGHSLYVAPSLAYVGWTYTPLYYLLAAGVAKVIGIGFLPLRLVSLVASVGAMAILGTIVIRETGDRVAGLLAAGVFAATFAISGAWFDVGRVDSLFLALTLVTIATGRRVRRGRDGIALGILAFLAYFTKQSALVALVPTLVVVAVARPRAGLTALGTVLGLVGGSTVLLDALTHGWYRYYVFDELAHQPWAPGAWVNFWTDDVLSHLWPALAMIAGGGALLARPRRRRWRWPDERRSAGLYYGVAAAGLLASAWLSRLHTGGYANVLMPGYAGVALLVGLVFGHLPRTGTACVARLAAGGLVLLQLALLAYPVGAQIPTAADRAAGAALIARIRALGGPVLVLRHPWYATAAGRGSFAQAEAIGDVLRSADARGAQTLLASLQTGLDADHIRAVVLDGGFDAAVLGPELERQFHLQRRPVTVRRLYPLTDLRTSPTLLYLRCDRVCAMRTAAP